MRLALLALVAFSLAATADAGVIYVKKGATGANNGTSWADAFAELRDALPTAQPGDEVWVAAGTYTPTSASQSFVVDRVRLLGGFAGTETIADQCNWALYPTILSGDVLGNDVGFGGADNCTHVVRVTGIPSRVQGFLIEGGVALGTGVDRQGAGMLVDTPPTTDALDVANCVFRRNVARRGAGIHVIQTGFFRVESCLFTDDRAEALVPDDGGAGLFNEDSIADVVQCTFGYLQRPGPGTTTPSAIHHSGTGVKAIGCVFYMNTYPSVWYGPVSGLAYPFSEPGISITLDPQFVDPAQRDFRLLPSSPCRDRNVPAFGVAGQQRDLAGLRRGISDPSVPPYDNDSRDYGAYEFPIDCNANGAPDYLESVTGAVRDLNHNEVPDTCEPIGTAICLGDGTGAPCPCGNAGAGGRGCENSSTTGGGRLSAVGLAIVSNDTLLLHVDGLGPTAPALFFQGNGLDLVGGSTGLPFGDGLRCVFGQILRLPIKNCVNGQASTGAGIPGDVKISILGAPVTPGTRYYQAWYRDSAPFCTPAFYNMTNAVQITWGP